MLNRLRPKQIFAILDQIDSDPESYSLDRAQAMRRVFWTLACVSLCLLLIHYMKYFSTFRSSLALVSTLLNYETEHLLKQLEASGFLRLCSYLWWTAWHVIGYLLIPWMVVRWILRLSLVDMGLRWQDTGKHWQGYLLLLSPILLFVFIAAQGQDFVQHYPFYKLAGRSWFDLLAWEFLYLLQFVCLEFFFRGFMLQALRPAIGANAIWVMCVPYLMIHFPKLWPEATGAILFGLFLGILALRSRSIWGGVFVHAGVALSMDIASLVKQGNIPMQFMPTL